MTTNYLIQDLKLIHIIKKNNLFKKNNLNNFLYIYLYIITLNNIIFNDNNNDPFSKKTYGKVHLRVYQRLKNRKYITIIQSLESVAGNDYEPKDFLKTLKKELCCNGNITKHKEYGDVIQLQGDKRYDIKDKIIETFDVDDDQIEIHGS